MKKAVCFGEILWDLFPEGKKLGGAPLNVANRMAQNGVSTAIISAIGQDDLGQEIENELNKLPVRSFLQVHPQLPTGTVQVSLDKKGAASYTITQPVAWDAICLQPEIETQVQNSDCLVFGSLVTRNEVSRKTLDALLPLSSFNVFDINLRPPHYKLEGLFYLMKKADLIKLNDEELVEITASQGLPFLDVESQIQWLATHTQTDQICVTLGEKGAVWYTEKRFIYQSGFPVIVADTVGAGDSFLGTLLSGILTSENAENTLAKACAMGSLVASKSGANPHVTEKELNLILNSISP